MDLLIARQPILNVKQETVAYELLFRNGTGNAFSGDFDGDAATMTVINNAFLQMGVGGTTGGRKAFVNFTRELLLGGYAELLPQEHTVIEILETIVPDGPVVEACADLVAKGYTIALDDYVGTGDYAKLLPHVKIIKADLMGLSLPNRAMVGKEFSRRGFTMLAEKVETREEFDASLAAGYTLFQGYFFSKPVIISSKRPPESKLGRLRLLQEVSRPDLDIDKVDNIVKHDPPLAAKLLRYINSAAFALWFEVKSVRQALTLLGQRNLSKWAAVLVASGMADDKPSELLRQTVHRARFCELLGGASHKAADISGELFMVGMLSTMDALLDQPMEQVLSELPLLPSIKDAIISRSGRFADYLLCVEAFERGDWAAVQIFSSCHGVAVDTMGSVYRDAAQWADSIADA